MRIVALIVALSGCALYWEQSPKPSPTPDPVPCGAPEYQVRNVETGLCEYQGDCPGTEGAPWTPILPACTGRCSDLGESACLASTGCHGAYAAEEFAVCWETIPGVQHDGLCGRMDAFTCAYHDNCASWFENGRFDHCIAEHGGACSVDHDCAHTDRCDHGVCTPIQPCSSLTTEAACTTRADCVATYIGEDCTCIGQVCTCKQEVFSACQPR